MVDLNLNHVINPAVDSSAGTSGFELTPNRGTSLKSRVFPDICLLGKGGPGHLNAEVVPSGLPARNPAFDLIIGQERAKGRLDSLVVGATSANTVFVPMLLLGPSGHGKTKFCKATAKAMGSNSVLIRCNKDLTISDLIRYLQPLRPYDVVILDEIHALKTAVQIFLLAVLDGGRIQNPDATSDPNSQFLEFAPLCFLATTTRCDAIYSDLRNRLASLELEPYSLDDMASMAVEYCRNKGFHIDPDAALILARVSFGTPRKISQLLAELTLVNRNRFAISKSDCDRFLLELGLHPDGWDAAHHKYLAYLKERNLSRNNLIRLLKVDDGTFEELEASLVQAGLVIIEKSNGRMLTHKGRIVLVELELAFKRQ